MKNYRVMLLKLFGVSGGVLALLFMVYMLSLDTKLIQYVVYPFLEKHYDKQKFEHEI